MAQQLPPSGSLIRFTVLPTCSYASVGVVYRVDYPKRRDGKPPQDLSLRNVETGSGTMDRLWAWKAARWEAVEA